MIPYLQVFNRIFETTCLALHSRKLLCKLSWENVKPHHQDSNQGPFAYRAEALTAALWRTSHPQWRKHDIPPTCLHLLATHTTQVGLRPQTTMRSAAFLVKLPSWQTLDLRKVTLRVLLLFNRVLRPHVSLYIPEHCVSRYSNPGGVA